MADSDDNSDAYKESRLGVPKTGSRVLTPKEFLSHDEYVSFHDGRLLSVVFVFAGCLILLVAIVTFNDREVDSDENQLLRYAWGVIGLTALAGVIGGVAGYRGNRPWTRLAYPFAGGLLLAVPIGSLWMLGLRRHLEVCEIISRARASDSDCETA